MNNEGNAQWACCYYGDDKLSEREEKDGARRSGEDNEWATDGCDGGVAAGHGGDTECDGGGGSGGGGGGGGDDDGGM